MSQNKTSIAPFEFDESFQMAVACLMLHDKMFLTQCTHHVSPSMFVDPQVGKIVDLVYTYQKKCDRPPASYEEMKSIISGTFYGDYHTQKKHLDKFNEICLKKELYLAANIKTQMTGWIQHNVFKHEIQKIAEVYNQRKYDEVPATIMESHRKALAATFETDDREVILDFNKFYDEIKAQEAADCCTIGHPDFDEILKEGSKIKNANAPDLTGSTRGSLIPGQTSILLGPTNSGKTTTIVTIAVANILMGKNVMVVSHEQKSSEIFDKILRCLAGLPKGEYEDMVKNPDHPLKGGLIKRMYDNLYYHHWVKSGNMYVEPVIAMIRQSHERLKAETGHGYDLVIDDYPGKLKLRSSGRNSKRYEEMCSIYDEFVIAAKQDGYHCLLPAQVNRAGYLNNRGDGDSTRMLDAADSAGSFDLTHLADNIITINRNPRDVAANRIKFHMAKSRSASTGLTFVTKTDFGRSCVMGPSLASRIFRPGESPTDDNIDFSFGEAESAGLYQRITNTPTNQDALFHGRTPDGNIPREDIETALSIAALRTLTQTEKTYLDDIPAYIPDGDADETYID